MPRRLLIRYWTPEDDAELESLLRLESRLRIGKSLTEIAVKLKRSRETIRSRARSCSPRVGRASGAEGEGVVTSPAPRITASFRDMVDEDDVELEESPLSGEVTRDGITLRVQIYRIRGSNEGWSLEVVDREGGSTVWQDLFPSDQDAYREFTRTLDAEGPRALSWKN